MFLTKIQTQDEKVVVDLDRDAWINDIGLICVTLATGTTVILNTKCKSIEELKVECDMKGDHVHCETS